MSSINATNRETVTAGGRLDVGIVDGQLLVHPFGQDEGVWLAGYSLT
ncbi:hypothetical protein ACOZ32_13670 (plasmid) [Halobacterium sp. MBLA0001]|nr:hypothetical protein [Halobacterium salinarum]